MKEIEQYNNVNFLGLYKGNMVLWYPDRLVIEDKVLAINDGDDFVIWSDSKYLEMVRENKRMIYDNGQFVDWPQGRYGHSNRIGNYVFSENNEGSYTLSIIQDKTEYIVKVDHLGSLSLCSAFEDTKRNVLLLREPIFNCRYLLSLCKNGERLWEYKEEDENLKINGRCIPVVDDVVVVISEDCGVPGKVQGFNIHTGKKLWEISNAEEIVCPNTFFVGKDQYLYGCCTECAYYDEESKLIMTKLNPKNGNTESIDVGMGFSAMSYDVTMHGRQLYYIDNRPGNEIGVIDVDRKELVERVPLNIKKKVIIGAPVVTDDKVYVFIRDLKELRVFEK